MFRTMFILFENIKVPKDSTVKSSSCDYNYLCSIILFIHLKHRKIKLYCPGYIVAESVEYYNLNIDFFVEINM